MFLFQVDDDATLIPAITTSSRATSSTLRDTESVIDSMKQLINNQWEFIVDETANIDNYNVSY